MHRTTSDAMASVIILTAAAVVALGTVSAYAVTLGNFNGPMKAQAAQQWLDLAANRSDGGYTGPNGAFGGGSNGGFQTRSQDYWAEKRASGLLGKSSGSGGTAMQGGGGFWSGSGDGGWGWD